VVPDRFRSRECRPNSQRRAVRAWLGVRARPSPCTGHVNGQSGQRCESAGKRQLVGIRGLREPPEIVIDDRGDPRCNRPTGGESSESPTEAYAEGPTAWLAQGAAQGRVALITGGRGSIGAASLRPTSDGLATPTRAAARVPRGAICIGWCSRQANSMEPDCATSYLASLWEPVNRFSLRPYCEISGDN
jgi:hypothetical protein